jgi:hypothetical protein
LLIKEPFELIRDSFVELAGGTLQNKEEKEKIEKILTEHLTPDLLKKSYISKTGSSYFIVAYINGQEIDKIGFEKLEKIKAEILVELKKIHQYAMFEIAID